MNRFFIWCGRGAGKDQISLYIEACALKEGLKKGIQGMVEILRDLGYEDIKIRQIIQKKYDLSDKVVSEFV